MTPHQQKVAAGAALVCLGSWMLYQTYDKAGRRPPFWLRAVPGL